MQAQTPTESRTRPLVLGLAALSACVTVPTAAYGAYLALAGAASDEALAGVAIVFGIALLVPAVLSLALAWGAVTQHRRRPTAGVVLAVLAVLVVVLPVLFFVV